MNTKNAITTTTLSLFALVSVFSLTTFDAFAEEEGTKYKMADNVSATVTFTFRDGVETHAFPIFIIMNLLSGGTTPLESMPQWLQGTMQFVPSTHFVNFAQAILYRGAGFDIVWKDFAAITAIGIVYFLVALIRFRKTITTMQT